ncbi:hypothetical protein [Bacillus sp. NTK034]|uniref:hypothetical protein n=1 Tax=Bacillus sp. NTK034 TaxID=2802176 RepID=UPI001A8D7AD1|nr:hypothetical protein [Bacillus sp. NTK034]MBN8199367.1 hypothetical protein [Bacillus sp. NTK034]
MKKLFEVSFLLGIEIIFGALMLFPFYMAKEGAVPLTEYFVFVFPAGMAFVVLLIRFREKGKVLFFLVELPLLFVIGNILSFSWFFIVLISFFVFWRTYVHFNEHNYRPEGWWILLTVFSGTFLVIFSAMKDGAYTGEIVGLMILELFFIISGGFIKRIIESDANAGEKKRFLIHFLSLTAAILAVGIIVSFGMGTLKFFFFGILKLIASAAALIASPLFNWAEGQDWEIHVKFFSENENRDNDERFKVPADLGEGGQFFDPAVLTSIFFIGVITSLFIYIYKKNIKVKSVRNGAVFASYSQQIEDKGTLLSRRFQHIAPENQIRKEIFQLERYAVNLDLGRKESESLPEWLQRIGLKDPGQIVDAYETVRYSNNVSTQSVEKYKYAVDQMKKEMKRIHKDNLEKKQAKKNAK